MRIMFYLRLPCCFASAAPRSDRRARPASWRAAARAWAAAPRQAAALQDRRPILQGAGAETGTSTCSAAAGAAGAAGAVGGAFGLFLLPGGLPRRLGAGLGVSAAGSAGTGGASGCGLASSWIGAVSSILFLMAFISLRSSEHGGSAVQIDAEADAGAAEVDRAPVHVRQPEAEVAQRDGAPDVHQVVLVGARFHDVPHAAVADDLGHDVVTQRPHGVRRVGQAAAPEVELRVGHHLHEGQCQRS